MALLAPFFLDAVTAIGVDDGAGNRHWIGTGFLYGKFVKKVDDSKNEYSVFLVTNKHVLSGLKRIYLKFNSAADSTSKDYPIDLVAKNGKPIWVGHPNADVDVAVMLVDANQLKNELRKFALIQSDQHVLDTDRLKADGVSEGDGVFVLGFPLGMVDQERQYVICRSGSIARIRDLIDGKASNFLIDATVFPGNSGGPVIIRPDFGSITGTKAIKSSGLIGIVKSYVTYQDVAVSQQTKTRRIVFEENSGLTTVEPVEHLLAAVEVAMKRTKERVAQARWQAKRQSALHPESTSTPVQQEDASGR